jgi:competence protein ComEC
MHFNRMAKWGFAGNLLAMPIFTFLVMPAALLSLIAMPFGLEAVPLKIMGYSLGALLVISDYVASWPGALAYIKSPYGPVIALYSLGFLWLCLGGKKLRLLSLGIFALCAGLWTFTPTPDMRISDDGRIAILKKGQSEKSGLYVSSKRADRYGREQFIQRAGIAEATTYSYQNTLALCDALACRLSFGTRSVSIINHPSEVPQECASSDLVIVVSRRAGPVARRNCSAVLIDARDFKANGAYDVYLSGKTLRLIPSNSKGRQARPWGIRTYRRS